MRRRRRGPLVFWIVLVAFLLANYVLVRWLVPSLTGPTTSAAHPALFAAAAHPAISAGALPAISAAA